jgi:hypothetical protein
MATPIDRIGLHKLTPTLKALAKAGGDVTHADWIRSGDNAKLLIKFINEQREPRVQAPVPTLIDCDVAPFIPKGWSIHPKDQIPGAVSGQLEFDPARILLLLDEGQKDGKTTAGNELKDRLSGKPLLKANVLDHLLANPTLIPEAWKTDEQGRTRYIFFWGTVYRAPSGSLCVRCLCWNGGEWGWDYHWLGGKFGGQRPAAVLAS